uniref:adenylate cyclase n=1 Tax=Timema tahoe TaxID=61484 RepID=A0A7R9FJI6_9NEOP|nr:unnamed protein product [Timema tahoe]
MVPLFLSPRDKSKNLEKKKLKIPGVNMRVGVHTGTVLCGIVGKKRFKFDVWSNDVSLANQMESTGKPGRVHISQATAQFLGEIYVLEEGEPLHGLNTYFIKGRKADITYESFLRQKSSKIFPVLIAPPPSSPLLAPQSRPRVLSCIHPVAATKRPHYLHLMTTGSLPNSVSQIKASSLPSILDSDNEAEELAIKQKEGKKSKSPMSLSGGGQSSPKGKPWLYQKTNQIEPEEIEPLGVEIFSPSSPSELRAEIKENEPSSQQEFTNYSSPMASLVLTDSSQLTSDSQQLEEIEPLGVEIFSPSSPSELRAEIKENEPSSQQVDDPRDAVRIEPAVMQLEVPGPMNNDDQLSVCLSVYSRKDSGIRSNSRRSSIQQQLFVMNGLVQGELLTHRVSGYYTSSQSTLNDESDTHFKKVQLPGPLSDSFGTCFHKLRKQSDLQLIRCVQDNVTSHHSYFTKPPLSRFTVFFRQKEMEREYRARAHRINEKHGGSPPTLATSRFNTYFDILISALVYTMIAISLFLLFEISPEWIAVCVVATFVQIFAVSLCVRQLLRPQYGSRGSWEFSKKIFDILSQWYPWHICGAVLVSLPIVSILVNFTCLNSLIDSSMDYYFSYLLFVGLVHFCNFTQLNCWMKSVLASVAGIIFVSLVACQFCPPLIMGSTSHNLTQTESTAMNANNLKTVLFANTTKLNVSSLTQSPSVLNTTSSFGGSVLLKNADFYTYNLYQNEIFLDVLLLLVLVWFLNREFEISYRLSFHGNIVAAKDKARVQNMKDQADLLLHNIIPKHVADTLKNTAKYSENHKDVGIIFASIVNFNEMYDESYLGGKEYLRVLNELIADFDDLLAEPQFRNVEKIKTIGSTFMAASGLNPEVRRQSRNAYEHLFELMDFAMAMQKVVDNFNRDLLEFNLILRVGYNFGDVTAGVIGTTKLYYDIWGDAVNIASRMDSTGIRSRIQVGENCISVLSERYLFEPRGYVYVKGKDNMMVYLVKGKCEDVCIDNG